MFKNIDFDYNINRNVAVSMETHLDNIDTESVRLEVWRNSRKKFITFLQTFIFLQLVQNLVGFLQLTQALIYWFQSRTFKYFNMNNLLEIYFFGKTVIRINRSSRLRMFLKMVVKIFAIFTGKLFYFFIILENTNCKALL